MFIFLIIKVVWKYYFKCLVSIRAVYLQFYDLTLVLLFIHSSRLRLLPETRARPGWINKPFPESLFCRSESTGTPGCPSCGSRTCRASRSKQIRVFLTVNLVPNRSQSLCLEVRVSVQEERLVLCPSSRRRGGANKYSSDTCKAASDAYGFRRPAAARAGD